MQRRIKHDFRQMKSPSQFLLFCRKVEHGLDETPNLPDVMAALRQQFSEKLAGFERLAHLALDGSRSVIRERDKLRKEIVVLLDQMASILEAAFIQNPDALLTTGFTTTQERRSTNRVRMPLDIPSDFQVANDGERGRAIVKASSFPGALMKEIHINLKDPSVENDWFHKAIFPASQNMVLDNLEAGNTFFRMRYQGQDGPGPWSAVVSTTIS